MYSMWTEMADGTNECDVQDIPTKKLAMKIAKDAASDSELCHALNIVARHVYKGDACTATFKTGV